MRIVVAVVGSGVVVGGYVFGGVVVGGYVVGVVVGGDVVCGGDVGVVVIGDKIEFAVADVVVDDGVVDVFIIAVCWFTVDVVTSPFVVA